MKQYYSLKKILSKAKYNIIYSMSGNGKFFTIIFSKISEFLKNDDNIYSDTDSVKITNEEKHDMMKILGAKRYVVRYSHKEREV